MSEGGVNKIMAVVLAAIVLALVAYGISIKGFAPIRENAAEKFNEIQLLFGNIKDGTASDNCRDRKIDLEDSEIEGILNVCEDFCSYELITPSDLLKYKEFSLDDGGYNARMVDFENFDRMDAFGSDPDVSDLHRDAYLVLKEEVVDFSTDYGNNFLELLGTDFDSLFRVTLDNDYTLTWDGENWEKWLKDSEPYFWDNSIGERVLLEDIKTGEIIKDKEGAEYKVDIVTGKRVDTDVIIVFNAYGTESRKEIIIRGLLGSTLKAQGYERVFKPIDIDGESPRLEPEQVNLLEDTLEGVWGELDKYVKTRYSEGLDIELDREAPYIRFFSKVWSVLRKKAYFSLDENDGSLRISLLPSGGAYCSIDTLGPCLLSKEVKEIAKELNLVLINYRFSLGESNVYWTYVGEGTAKELTFDIDDEVYSEIYDEYEKINSNVYWNYVGEGIAKELTFDTDVNFMDELRSKKEIKEWMDKIAEDVDFMGDDYSVTIKIKGATRNYLYKNGAWHKSGYLVGSSLDEGVVLEALLKAQGKKKIITLIYEKVEKEKFDGWLDEKTKISEYTKEQQDDLFLELSNYLEGATVNFRGKDFPIIIKRNEESNRIIIYFEDDDGNRFGVYSDEKNLVLTYGDEKSIVSDWVSLGDADWVKFLKINKINKYISYRCPV